VRRGTRNALLVLASLVLGTAAVLLALQAERRTPPGPPEARERPAVPVEVAHVTPMTLEETVHGIGTLRATAQVELRAELAGRVHAIHFVEGGPVEEGQLLVELDESKLRRRLEARQAALAAAEVRERNARRTLERQQQLREGGLVPEEEVDRAQTELDAAHAEVERLEAELALIEEELAETRIRAPFTGVISERRVDRGAFITMGEVLAHLYQIDPLEIAFSVPERHMGRVRRGQPVRVAVAAYPDRPFVGAIDFVSPVVEEATRDFLVKAAVPNPDGQLKPGAFATAVVTVGRREERPAIPEEALVATRHGYMVFVIEDGVARMQPVRTGLRRGGHVEVLEGLTTGEQVVRRGHLRLSGGERVREAGPGAPDARLTRGEEEEAPARGSASPPQAGTP
jgi:membrane fusion protein, multidrug efflux system